MNTNSNTYTVIYSTVLVVVVAAVLAFAAMALKPMQDENIKKETITQVLTAAAPSDSEVNISEGMAMLQVLSRPHCNIKMAESYHCLKCITCLSSLEIIHISVSED